jgi:cytochrome c biogenesis factor
MLEAVISLLIWVCVIALVIYLVIWVLQTVVGLPLPAKVIQILWVIFALIVILMLARLLLGGGGISLPKIS